MKTTDIYVDDTPPVIVYQYGVVNSGVTGNTTIYCDASTGITSGITVTSGFIFNLSGFSSGEISRMDIIDNVIDHVYDNLDVDINKYMLDVLVAGPESGVTLITYGKLGSLGSITQPGYYLCKFSISDISGNENIVTSYKMIHLISFYWTISDIIINGGTGCTYNKNYATNTGLINLNWNGGLSEATRLLNTATERVVIAEATTSSNDKSIAQDYVSAMTAGTDKTNLQNRLNAI